MGNHDRTRQLLSELSDLRVDHQLGKPATYQQVVLLWSIARALVGEGRLVSFSVIKGDLARRLRPIAVGSTAPNPAFPWFALDRTDWWQLALSDTLKQSGARGRDLVREHDPRAGLSKEAYHLVRHDAAFRDQAIQLLAAQISEHPNGARLVQDFGFIVAAPPAAVPIHLVTEMPTDIAVEDYLVPSMEATTHQLIEANLQDRYRKWLEKQGHETCRHKVVPQGEVHPLFTDLYGQARC